MDLELKDKVFMVAASSSGLGYGIAKSLLKEGAFVALTSRNQTNLDQAIDQIKTTTNQTNIRGYLLDVCQPESINQWVIDVLSDYKKIDGLVVNAGGPMAGNFDDFDDQDWQKTFELTLLSAVRIIRCVLPAMRSQKHGSILTITSSSVKEPIDHLLLSNVFRSGIASLVKTLSADLSNDNIRINNLIPGRINTKRVQKLDELQAKKQAVNLNQYQKNQFHQIPLGRYGHVDEFAKAATFLLSNAASYIHGTNLVVDGGKIKTL